MHQDTDRLACVTVAVVVVAVVVVVVVVVDDDAVAAAADRLDWLKLADVDLETYQLVGQSFVLMKQWFVDYQIPNVTG